MYCINKLGQTLKINLNELPVKSTGEVSISK